MQYERADIFSLLNCGKGRGDMGGGKRERNNVFKWSRANEFHRMEISLARVILLGVYVYIICTCVRSQKRRHRVIVDVHLN